MRKIFYLTFLFSLFCCRLYAWQQVLQDTAQNPGSPQLTFVNNDTVYDFGGIPKGAFVEYQFEIRNTGGAPLIISAMKCESANVKCKWPSKPLKPGKKAFVSVIYTANTDEGSFREDIFVASNTTENPYPFIHISGAIVHEGSPMIPSATPAHKSHGGRLAH